LQRGEQLIEPLVALLPILPIAGQPHRRFAQRLGAQVAESGGGPPGASDQPGTFEHLEVPGDRGLRDAERRRKLGDARLTLPEPHEDLSSRGIRERSEHRVELNYRHHHL
jgi:hypothetical protein